MIVGALIPNFNDLTPSWLTRACHTVALYSYSIYLFHLPVIWFAFVKLRVLPSWLQWVSLWVLMCVIPWMAYTWLEAPLIEAGRRLANRLLIGKVLAGWRIGGRLTANWPYGIRNIQTFARCL
jgi:peptidoglycan/LPS O-acetylase OafA/YrhL